MARECWGAAAAGVSAEAAQALVDEARARWAVDPGPEAEWSGRIAMAPDRALDDAGALGGTVNGHGLCFWRSPTIGIPACLGVACQTEADRPITCTATSRRRSRCTSLGRW